MSLDRLSPAQNQQSTDVRKHQLLTQSQIQATPDRQVPGSHSSKQPHFHRFNLNERVVAFNKQGIAIHGSVRWIGEVGEKLVAVGIETVKSLL